jgi:hypothetical protein
VRTGASSRPGHLSTSCWTGTRTTSAQRTADGDGGWDDVDLRICLLARSYSDRGQRVPSCHRTASARGADRSAFWQAEVPLVVVAPGLSQGRAPPSGPASARQPVWPSRATRPGLVGLESNDLLYVTVLGLTEESVEIASLRCSASLDDHVGVRQLVCDQFGDGQRVRLLHGTRFGARRTTALNTPPSARPADRPSPSRTPRTTDVRPMSTNGMASHL